MSSSPVSSSRDPVLESRLFIDRFKREILAAIIVLILAIGGVAGYRLYHEHRHAAAADLLAAAKSPADYQKVIEQYPGTPAEGNAYLLLAAALRNEQKFAEANAVLQTFISKNPKHPLVTTARMAIAANLESLGKIDEALIAYRQVAANYPQSFNAPLALLAQIHLLKAKNGIEDARRVCEVIMTQYRESFAAAEAARQLRLLKPREAAPEVAPPPAAQTGPPPATAAPKAAPAPTSSPVRRSKRK